MIREECVVVCEAQAPTGRALERVRATICALIAPADTQRKSLRSYLRTARRCCTKGIRHHHQESFLSLCLSSP